MATHLIGTFDIVGMFRDLYPIQVFRERELWLHEHGLCTYSPELNYRRTGEENCDV